MDVGDTCTCVASAPQPQTGNMSRRVRTAFTARTQYRDLTRGARMELRLRHFAVLRVRLREKCDVPRLQRAPHAHLVRGFGPLRGLLGPARRNAAMGPTGELPTEIRGPALHICSVESAMFAWRTRRTSRASGSKSSAWTERPARRSASSFRSTTGRRRSREGSSPQSRHGTDPLGRCHPGTPSRRAT